MNSALKHTIIAMATAALSMTAACKSDDGPEATEATTGAETAAAEAAAPGETAIDDADDAAEASCGEGSCSGAKEGEASCGEGSCGGEKK
jgi:uncharacterized low-complexity protein